MSLANEACEPCRGGVPPLDAKEAARLLADVPDWELLDEARKLSRTFKFSNFLEAMDFVRWVGDAAERANHHPDITFGWGYATVVFYTHKINGLHRNDFVMAARVNDLYEG